MGCRGKATAQVALTSTREVRGEALDIDFFLLAKFLPSSVWKRLISPPDAVSYAIMPRMVLVAPCHARHGAASPAGGVPSRRVHSRRVSSRRALSRRGPSWRIPSWRIPSRRVGCPPGGYPLGECSATPKHTYTPGRPLGVYTLEGYRPGRFPEDTLLESTLQEGTSLVFIQ